MRMDEITQSGVELQHALCTVAEALDTYEGSEGMQSGVSTLRRASVRHAGVVSCLVERARALLGDDEKLRGIATLLDELLESTAILTASAAGGQESANIIFSYVTIVTEELLGEEQQLLGSVGSVLFPADTW